MVLSKSYFAFLRGKITTDTWPAELIAVVIGLVGHTAYIFFDVNPLIQPSAQEIIHSIGSNEFWRIWIISSLLVDGTGLLSNNRWLRISGSCMLFWAMCCLSASIWKDTPWIPSFWLYANISCLLLWTIVRQVTLLYLERYEIKRARLAGGKQ